MRGLAVAPIVKSRFILKVSPGIGGWDDEGPEAEIMPPGLQILQLT